MSGLRNSFAIGVVSAVNDNGGAKTVNVSAGTGVNRADVEVMDIWGFTSNPPTDGIITIVFPIGGDPGNLRALPPGNPSARMGQLLVGEAAIYAADGSRLHIRQGGIVDIWGGAQVNVHTKECTINAPNGCTINGNVTVNGTLTATNGLRRRAIWRSTAINSPTAWR